MWKSATSSAIQVSLNLKADHADRLQLGNGLRQGHQGQHLRERNALEGSVQTSHQDNLAPGKCSTMSGYAEKLNSGPVSHLLAPGDDVREKLTLVNPNHVVLSGSCCLTYVSSG